MQEPEPPSTGRPLVSFILLAYNQEEFIREAVESAFSQTYSPLEIILSDDYSPDKTFEIMQEMAGGYKGPHKVEVRQTPLNLGFIKHISHVFASIKEGLVVLAAGDDISVPCRTEDFVSVWAAANFEAKCLYSAFRAIDLAGRFLPDHGPSEDISRFDLLTFSKDPRPLLCSYAVTTDLVTGFKPFGGSLCNEDFVFPFRALLLGTPVVFVAKPLVHYRKGSGHDAEELSVKATRESVYKSLLRFRWMIEQLLSDLTEVQPSNIQVRKELERNHSKAMWMVSINRMKHLESIRYTINWSLAGKISIYCTIRDYLRARHPQLHRRLQSYKIRASRSTQGAYDSQR